MRITGGEARGRSVACPEGLIVRPTASKIRQAFFNILAGKIHSCDFLDVFAGSGLMGIEALSRGAASLTAVDESRKIVQNLQANLKALGYDAQVITGDYKLVLATLPPMKFDVIFADPPYKASFAKYMVHAVATLELLKPQGVLVVEHQRSFRFDESAEETESVDKTLHYYDRREYGQTALSFFSLPES